MLILLAICMGLATASAVGLGAIASRRKEQLDEANYELNKYRNSYGDVIGQLQAAQDENLTLSTQALDSVTSSISNEQIMQFIKANSTKFAHKWIQISRSEHRNLGPKKYSDVVINEHCSCCGMVRRYWRDGDGAKYMKGYEGTFLGKTKITDEFRQVVCIGLLPLEFINRKNSEMVKELVTVNELIEHESFEEILKRSGK